MLTFGIVTPTINRETLLRRHLRRVGRQTYKLWRLFVVHDGPDPAIRSMVEGFGESDARIKYFETQYSARDWGVTPRLEGVRRFIASCKVPDYLVFWDDDNLYRTDALERGALALESAGCPDLLLAAVKYRSQTIPPAGAIKSLDVGQVDTASMIFRPELAFDAYASVKFHTDLASKGVLNDFLVFEYARNHLPPQRIVLDRRVLICQHDCLRAGPFIRSALRIPPLGLARLLHLGR